VSVTFRLSPWTVPLDRLGTERVRTSYNGAVALSINSLPWADGHTPSGDNGDQHDFAQMERDLEDNTEHAQFRQYSTNLGRWQSPDLYTGSYDLTNPQSFNRYTYALNNPANLTDPSGLYTCPACSGPIDLCFFEPLFCFGGSEGGGGYGGGKGGGGRGPGSNPANPGKPFVFSVTA
jgi:RHS repeat-associated protein